MTDELWVFGYGSLMWRPGFRYAERHRATLADHRRSFCLASVRYRGTPERPGLVLGLEEAHGHSCCGIAFRVDSAHHAATLDYLRERELVTNSYFERQVPIVLHPGETPVRALTYVIDPGHDQYRGGLSLDSQADTIASANGPMGANDEYLFKTVEELQRLDVRDDDLHRLAELVTERRRAVQTPGTEA